MAAGHDAEWNLLHERPGARLINCGPLICVYFTGEGPSDLQSLHHDFDVQDEVLARWGELSQLVVFEARKMSRIGGESRTVASTRLAKWGPSLRRSGLVLLGDGFGARMMRVALLTAITLSRTSAQHSIFDGLESALAWVQAAPGQHEVVRAAPISPLITQFGVPSR